MLRKINLLLAIIATLIISNTVFAQQNEDLEKQVESNMNVQNSQSESITERENNSNRRPFCTLQVQSTVTAGINDNLAAPFEATTQSPQLANIFPNTKDFDDTTTDQIFAHSFLLRKYKPCGAEACHATLLVRVCNSGIGYWENDKLYVGSAVGNTFTPSIFVGDIWNASDVGGQCKNVVIPINTPTLNSLINLDVVMQDDSSIDYMQLDWDF